MKLTMVDLKGQYLKIKPDIDAAIAEVIDSTAFINGGAVNEFAENLSAWNGVKYCIPCGNGTDALQIALMSLGLQRGDEVIVPAFTYVATAEVIGLLGLTPVMVDVESSSFNIDVNAIETAITAKTKAIVPVHLFGQCCNMEALLNIAQKHNLYVVEDSAQAIGAEFTFSNGNCAKAGTMGHFGCTSFFPSKNLGCYGDGGAIFTNDQELAAKAKMIANHGQKIKYYHSVIGCNSRLDTIQAAILNVKLKHLDEYANARRRAAEYYTNALSELPGIETPFKNDYSTHVYHQYTLIVKEGRRDELKRYLADKGIPSMIYYPLPLQEQQAFKAISRVCGDLVNSTYLASTVLSIPMHTELTKEQQNIIIEGIISFFKG